MNVNELMQKYWVRFVNRTDAWGRQIQSGYRVYRPGMDTKGGRVPYEPLTIELLCQHFIGNITCGLPAIDQQGDSKWICFDSDTEDGDLDQIESSLKSWGAHTIREGRRPGRAGHLWMLFDQPVSAALLVILGDAIILSAGARPASRCYTHGIERFPKSATGYSQVRGPLGVNRKPEAGLARSLFDGPASDPRSQLEWLASQPLNKAEDVIREALRYKVAQKPALKITRQRSGRQRGWSFRVLDFVAARQVGNALVAQCPLCSLEGHDMHRDNLHIKIDGSKFCCAFGGPNQIHKVQDIVDVLSGRQH